MKTKDGTTTSKREEILNICAEFYQELYSSNSKHDKLEFKSPDQTDILNITIDEIEFAVKQMKSNKAPGPDDVTSDIFRSGYKAWKYTNN